MTDQKTAPQTHTLPPTFRIPEWVLISRGPATFKISRRHRFPVRDSKMTCSKVQGCCERGVGRIKVPTRTTLRLDVLSGQQSRARGGIQCRDGCIYAIFDPTGESEMDALTRNMGRPRHPSNLLREGISRASEPVIMIMIMITQVGRRVTGVRTNPGPCPGALGERGGGHPLGLCSLASPLPTLLPK